ncbi:MAG: ribose 5-phosphate isomerase B [Gemmatimonadetes bacterium]|nr:MAG: ribose 5-phosphate isomerase B [Gemmatimonadota bacterium]
MKVAIGSDHGGYHLKETIKAMLVERNIDVTDFGTHSTESTDYPDYARQVAESVRDGNHDRGILICGTGIGMSIMANKVRGIRAALCTSRQMAELSRQHNNANVLCLGERILEKHVALDIVEAWFTAEFEGGRHERRVNKMMAYETNP